MGTWGFFEFTRITLLDIVEILEDDYLILLLRCPDKLELIIVDYCDKITKAVLKVAIEETKKRQGIMLIK